MFKRIFLIVFIISLLSCVDTKLTVPLELELVNPNGSKTNIIVIKNLPVNFEKVKVNNLILGINSEITDAVTQTNVKIVGEAPAVAMGMIYNSQGQKVAGSLMNNIGKNVPAYLSEAAPINDILELDCSSCDVTDKADIGVAVSFILNNQLYKGVINNVKFNGA